MADDIAGLGHNFPPPDEAPKTLQEVLADRYADLAKRIEELQVLAESAPLEVKTEEQFKPLSDLLKAGRVAVQMSEAARKIENEESRKRTAMIDAWFKNPVEKLSAAMKAVKERTDVYLEEKKAAEEKRRKELAEEKARAAEEKRWDAIWAEARSELAAYDAKKAEEAALAARVKKERELRRADHLRDRAKRMRKVEPYLARRADRRRKAEEAAAEAQRLEDERQAQLAAEEDERKRLAEEAAQRHAKAQEEARKRQAEADAERAANLAKAQADADEAKKTAAAARREENKASAAADAHAESAEEHADLAEDLGGAAGRMEKRAERADRHANAGSASMSRTRSEMGTTASLSKSWKVVSFDRNVIDLNLLRGYLHPDAVEVAVRGFMMAHRTDAGGPKLEGAVFEQVEEGTYR